MGYNLKLNNKICNNCGYTSNGKYFRKIFLKWFFGPYICPKCKSHNVSNTKRPKILPAPQNV